VKVTEAILRLVKGDILQIFGDSGSGKSKFLFKLAKSFRDEGFSFYFIDTERNLSSSEYDELKGSYSYNPLIDALSRRFESIPKSDVLLVDSIGFPIYIRFAKMSMRERGDALLLMARWLGEIKEWCYRHGSSAIVSNQPKSEIGEEEVRREQKYTELPPFGGKSVFACKEIWRTRVAKREENHTCVYLDAFRSRVFGYRTELIQFEIKGNDLSFKWLPKVEIPEAELPPIDAEAEGKTYPVLFECPEHKVVWLKTKYGFAHKKDDGKWCRQSTVIDRMRDDALTRANLGHEEFFNQVRSETGKSWTELTAYDKMRIIEAIG